MLHVHVARRHVAILAIACAIVSAAERGGTMCGRIGAHWESVACAICSIVMCRCAKLICQLAGVEIHVNRREASWSGWRRKALGAKRRLVEYPGGSAGGREVDARG